MFSCSFCDKIFEKSCSKSQHQIRCRSNPDSIASNQYVKAKKEGRTIVISEATIEKFRQNNLNKSPSKETRNKISCARRAYLAENPDKVPYKLNHSSKGPSYPEQYFESVFKERNLGLESQWPVAAYSLDFADVHRQVDIEIHGEQHYVDPVVASSDVRRRAYLQANGWHIIEVRWSDFKMLSTADKQTFITNLIHEIETKEILNSIPPARKERKRTYSLNHCKICGTFSGKNLHCAECMPLRNFEVSVEEIYKEYLLCKNVKKLARQFKVSQDTIRNKLKQHPDFELRKQNSSSLSTQEIYNIWIKNDKNFSKAARLIGISDNAIRRRFKTAKLI